VGVLVLFLQLSEVKSLHSHKIGFCDFAVQTESLKIIRVKFSPKGLPMLK
jgi:hypothetical protein